MSIRLSPLCAALGAKIESLQPEALDETDKEQLRDALLEHGVLLARGVELSPDAHVELTRVFGEPDIHPIEAIRLPGHPEIIVLAADLGDSLDPGDPMAEDVVGRIPWHSDLTYTEVPSRGALLHALEVPPEGGQTGFADTAAIYDALPDDLVRRIEGLRVVHGFGAIQQENRAALESPTDGKAPEFPDVIHPLVHRHPESGRRVLNISPNFSRSIVGLSPEEADVLLEQLRDFATQDRFVYFHEWQVGDLVIWDNWRTQHTASGHKKKYARRMHRTTLRGGGLSGIAAVSGR